jgi:hypothetical protein
MSQSFLFEQISQSLKEIKNLTIAMQEADNVAYFTQLELLLISQKRTLKRLVQKIII